MTPAQQGGGEISPAVEMEGYLIAHAHRESAREEAETLCARLPWLTGAQAEEVARQYVLLRIGLTRRLLKDTAERAERLREEYEARYEDLRRTLLRRHAGAACATVACAAGLTALASMAAR
ncbi:hypothetical protein [Streptomyces fragilis]|uniref:Uncharacterized protein n=1 Tax=Streptomyces fragilis TaxID=67301 RepID=A0ABV2YLJ6_9ACTN|nr:hypothetical protein [Streptomyces fragilis]